MPGLLCGVTWIDRAFYLTADYWRSRARRTKRFLAKQEAAYKLLDAATQELTTRERKIGAY